MYSVSEEDLTYRKYTESSILMILQMHRNDTVPYTQTYVKYS